MTRRVAGSTLLLVALVLSLGAFRETIGKALPPGGELTITPTGAAVDAALTARPEILSGRWAEDRTGKVRLRLGVITAVGLSALLAFALAGLHRRSPRPRSLLSRRSGVILRAPPTLRLV